jgi:hypothetical protein
MRFYITMNMPSRSGSNIHQIIAEHPARSLDEFNEILSDSEFVVVEEFYRKQEGSFYSVGDIILNTMHIGKVKVSEK